MTLRSHTALPAVIFVTLLSLAACDRGNPAGESAPPKAADRGTEEKPALPEEKTLGPGVVATVNGEIITDAVYADHLAAAAFMAKHASFEGRMEVLQSLADRMVVIQDARARGMRDRPMIRQMIDRQLRRLVYGGVVRKIVESVPPVEEEEVDAALATPGERLDLTVILADDLETAEDAIARIGRGEEMEEVAAEISISPGVMQRNFRRLGLERGEGMYPPAVEEAIFALGDGEVSAPLATPVGYLVARVDRRQSPTPDEIAELRRRLEMDLRRKKVEKAVADEAARRREGTPATMLVERVADIDLPSADGNPAAVWRALEGVSVAEVDGVTLTLGDIMRDVPDYMQFLGSRPAAREKTYRRMLEGNIEMVLFARYARELGLDKRSGVVDALRIFEEQVLFAQYLADISLARTTENLDDGECRAFYEERSAAYPVPPLLTLSLILARKRELADEIVSRFRTGASFEAMAREHSADDSAARGGDLGPVLADELVSRLSEEGVKELVAAARAGQRGLITLRTTEGYNIFLISDFKDEGEGGYEAVRDRVLPDCLRFSQREDVEERMAALREAAVMTVDEEKVATIEPGVSETPTGAAPHGGFKPSGGGGSPHGGESPHGGGNPHGGSPPSP